jgi:hypothetical protein
MSDDFGTVNVKRGERSKEIEALRQQYGHHREALMRMVADAPTELLAKEYQRLIRELDNSLRKLDELEGRTAAERSEDTLRETDPDIYPNPTVRPATASGATAASAAPRTNAGDRPLAAPPQSGNYAAPVPSTANPQSRVALIVLAAVVVLALIGWMIYRASSDRRTPAPIAGTAPTAIETVGTNPNPPAEPIAPPAGMTPAPATGSTIAISPASADYGTIRKGTRAVRQFDVTNTSTAPIDITVGRSACRCLFYDYREKVPAKGKETITVTIDGARVKGNSLNETVKVSSKKDPAVTATFDVTAVIR